MIGVETDFLVSTASHGAACLAFIAFAALTWRLFISHDVGDDLFGAGGALQDSGVGLGEVDPAFVEAVQHANPRLRMAHALGAEDRRPLVPRNHLGAQRPTR